MAERTQRSVRLLFDLQACQTQGSAHRGVGRYSRSLYSAIARGCDPIELHALTSASLPHSVDRMGLRQDRVWQLPSLPEWQTPRSFAGGERDALDALACTALVQRLQPDVVHVSHVFEGLIDRVALPDPSRRAPGQVYSATLYDLIPLIFAEHYFAIPGLKRWYHARTAWLRQADLLLAISEATRQDAMRLLGIEPERIVTIHGGIGEHFAPVVDREAELARLRRVHPSLKRRFVLYTGGDDHRKNLDGAIAGYAALPAALRGELQLVIVCSMADDRRRVFEARAREAGLGAQDLLVTGFVPERDLVGLYSTCELFVFPSLYEGLGLPVLEAMACGAPVIGGDNSSIREIIGRDDALFLADNANSIAQRAATVLQDSGLRESLRRHGLERVRSFTWERSAAKALEAFDEAVARAAANGRRSAASGWLPRKRLAVLSPLPPARSGIADYNAAFLPYLARHFDIDLFVEEPVADDRLNAMFRAFDVREFEHVAPLYDLVLYEFGNSSFHAHMLDLIRRHPGVVGLHDAFLSGLICHLAYSAGAVVSYRQTMLDAHGPRARRYLGAQGSAVADGDATIELPCTREVLDHAIGVISHSPFNLAVARANHPEGWLAPYRTIPQMVELRAQPSSTEREAVRARHSVAPGDFVIVSYGHVAWTKWGDRLLAAFLSSPLRDDPRAHLVFAGELAEGTFGDELRKAISDARLGKRIRVTGYLSETDYEAYLAVADLAVQLRTRSRGGTPKGVLDCLAHGVPVVVNNDASYTDYPDDVVIKLAPEPAVDEIVAVLARAHREPAWAAGYAREGRAYVRARHDPTACAAAYAEAMHEFAARRALAGPASWPAAFAPHLAGCPDPEASSALAHEWLEALPDPVFRRRRVYFDVSHIVQSDHQTGIPRVVKMIVRAMYRSSRAGFEPVAVHLHEGRLVEARAWLAQLGVLLEHETAVQPSEVVFGHGDVLLMLDSSWARYNEFQPAFAAARAAGARVVTAVYDLLPITLPPGNIVEGGKAWFEGWLREAAAASDGLVCISRAVADQLRYYLREQRLGRESLRVGYWHLGSDFASPRAGQPVSERVDVLRRKPYLLMIGTIEPRKCHELAVAAMEVLWRQGHELRLAIAGKEGWLVTELMARLRTHPELSRRLWLLEHPTDAEVASLYDHAAGLVFLSRGEGFGLPLVEAANHGVAILCSDIPVFREIAGSHATYSAAQDAAGLAGEIAAWNAAREEGRISSSSEMPRLTWEQSAEQLLDVVLEDGWLQEDPGDGNPDPERADAVREEAGAPVAVEPQES